MAARALKPPRSPGRPKGSKNKVPTFLKDAILLAGEKVGEVEVEERQAKDGRTTRSRKATGKGGLVGYLKGIALNEPVAFCGLVGRVLPMTVNAVTSGEVRLTIVTGVPRDNG